MGKKPSKEGVRGRRPAGAPPVTLILMVASGGSAEASEDAGTVSSVTESEDASLPLDMEGCPEISVDDLGRFTVEGTCMYGPPWLPSAGLDLFNGKVDGVVNQPYFNLHHQGKARLIAPLDGSGLTVIVEGYDGRVFHITPEHETHVVFTDYGTIKVKSVQGKTTVGRSYAEAEVLTAGNGKEYDLADTTQGCSASSIPRDIRGSVPFPDGLPLIMLFCLVVAGRRVKFFLTTNIRDRLGSRAVKD